MFFSSQREKMKERGRGGKTKRGTKHRAERVASNYISFKGRGNPRDLEASLPTIGILSFFPRCPRRSPCSCSRSVARRWRTQFREGLLAFSLSRLRAGWLVAYPSSCSRRRRRRRQRARRGRKRDGGRAREVEEEEEERPGKKGEGVS